MNIDIHSHFIPRKTAESPAMLMDGLQLFSHGHHFIGLIPVGTQDRPFKEHVMRLFKSVLYEDLQRNQL